MLSRRKTIFDKVVQFPEPPLLPRKHPVFLIHLPLVKKLALEWAVVIKAAPGHHRVVPEPIAVEGDVSETFQRERVQASTFPSTPVRREVGVG